MVMDATTDTTADTEGTETAIAIATQTQDMGRHMDMATKDTAESMPYTMASEYFA